jgi:hypothetical protein
MKPKEPFLHSLIGTQRSETDPKPRGLDTLLSTEKDFPEVFPPVHPFALKLLSLPLVRPRRGGSNGRIHVLS